MSITYDYSTLSLVEELFNEADQKKRKLLATFDRYYRYVRNRQLDSPRVPTHLQISEVFPTIHTILSWMTDSAPKVASSALPDIPQEELKEIYRKKAEDHDAVLEAWWHSSGAMQQLWLGTFDALVFGTGTWRTGWNDSAEDGRGLPSLLRVNPYCLLPDPLANDFDDARYVGEVRDVSMQDIALRWPDKIDYVVPKEGPTQRKQPSADGGFQFVPQFRSTGVTGAFPGTPTQGVPPMYDIGRRGIDSYTGRVTLKEFWIKEVIAIKGGEDGTDAIQVPRWRYIATAGDVVLEDGDNPFPHNQLPYVRMPCMDVGEFWGVPLVEHLGPLQDAENQIAGAISINARLIGMPMFRNVIGSGIEKTQFKAQPGAVYDVNPGVGSEVGWFEPPQMPPWMKDHLSWLQSATDRVSGISAVARGASLKRREPSESVDAVQEASFVRIRSVIRNMEEALRVGMNLISSNVVHFMTDERTIAKPHASSGPEYVHLGQKHFWVPRPDGDFTPLRFTCQVEAGSTHPLSRQARVSEIDHVYQMVGPALLSLMLKEHQIPNSEQVANQAQQMMQHGMGPPQGGASHSQKKK